MKKWVVSLFFMLVVCGIAGATEALIALQHIERCYSAAFYAEEYELALQHVNALIMAVPNNAEYLREKFKILAALGRAIEGTSALVKINEIDGEPANRAIWEAFNCRFVTDTNKREIRQLLGSHAKIIKILDIEPYTRHNSQRDISGGYEVSVFAKYGTTSFEEAIAVKRKTQNLVERLASSKSLFSSEPVMPIVLESKNKIERLTKAYNAAFYACNYSQALQVVELLLLEQPYNIEYLREKAKMQAITGDIDGMVKTIKLFPDDKVGRFALMDVRGWDRMPSYIRASIPNRFIGGDTGEKEKNTVVSLFEMGIKLALLEQCLKLKILQQYLTR